MSHVFFSGTTSGSYSLSPYPGCGVSYNVST